jgi:hypothetical protein
VHSVSEDQWCSCSPVCSPSDSRSQVPDKSTRREVLRLLFMGVSFSSSSADCEGTDAAVAAAAAGVVVVEDARGVPEAAGGGSVHGRIKLILMHI